ncbi:MAG: Holliday junction resolvase RuvX [Candidatus Anaerobiospirillum merdipullorum]|uniref:Putative pre-16S rRNA nuclease n=1 Tax=Candidatus Anaerobiospirillum merdipullorum TaxID=2838450 RepID=A0A9E2KPJ3_9GAMM|nr:Holliday junction resolvase RuvX [Candidatus Anaerobiospirillum merdipullorum]
MSFILAFDFGLNSVGTAIGNTVTRTVRPLKALRAKQGKVADEALASLIKEWQPQLLVVGLPLNMDGSAMTVTPAAKRFAKRLEQSFKLPVELIDERLTTKEAKAMLFAQGGYRALAHGKGDIDNLSAALILETYLDEH